MKETLADILKETQDIDLSRFGKTWIIEKHFMDTNQPQFIMKNGEMTKETREERKQREQQLEKKIIEIKEYCKLSKLLKLLTK